MVVSDVVRLCVSVCVYVYDAAVLKLVSRNRSPRVRRYGVSAAADVACDILLLDGAWLFVCVCPRMWHTFICGMLACVCACVRARVRAYAGASVCACVCGLVGDLLCVRACARVLLMFCAPSVGIGSVRRRRGLCAACPDTGGAREADV
jgi:hypothetical protein